MAICCLIREGMVVGLEHVCMGGKDLSLKPGWSPTRELNKTNFVTEFHPQYRRR